MRLKPVLTTALIAGAAFVLGLTLGDPIPREAAAQAQPAPAVAPDPAPDPVKPSGLDWKYDEKFLTVTSSASTPYLVEVRLKKGAPATSPSLPLRAFGSVRVPLSNLDSVGIYRMEGAASCGPRGCRPCDSIGGGDCPAPPRPPFHKRDSMTAVYSR